MFTRFLKRKPRQAAVLSAALILAFLLFPFYHFHPDNTHSHAEQLQVHVHPGHFHAEVVEDLAHLTHFHPTDPNLDQPFHQSHSLPDHDPDDSDFYTQSINVSPLKADVASKQLIHSAIFKTPQPRNFHPSAFEVLAFETFNIFGPPSQRSPPLPV